jgi:hypothetical protein
MNRKTRVGTAMISLRNTLPLAVIAAAATVLSVAAARMMFNTFMRYDDEGYVLLSLRNFAEHGALYRDVYSQYGPFPYAFYWLLHLVGMPLHHTSGRLVTLVLWACTAVFPTLLVWRWTRSLSTSLLILASLFLYLWPSVREPNHPGNLVAAIVALLAAIGCRHIAERKFGHWAAVAGAGAAVLLLTKINTGVFAAISIGTFALLYSHDPRVRRWSPPMLAVGFIILPVALMHTKFHSPWVLCFAIAFALGSPCLVLACAAVAQQDDTARCRWSDWVVAIIVATVASSIILGLVMPRGTGWSDLLEGVLLGPLRHPAHFSLHIPPGGALISGAACSAFAFVAAVRLRRNCPHVVDRGIVTIRIAAALATGASLIAYPDIDPHEIVFWWEMSWLWIFVWPLTDETTGHAAARAWLALLALGQWLHAYPVPGSQITWGSYLVLPLIVLATRDAVQWAGEQNIRLWPRKARGWIAAAIAAAAALIFVRLEQNGRNYDSDHGLNLPGGELIRLPAPAAGLYRTLCANAKAHADMLFSLPGMMSFNVWTGLPTPTHANVTAWFLLLNDVQQHEMIRSLETHARACVIVDTLHVEYLRGEGLAPRGALYDYLTNGFAPAFKIDDFEFWVRRGRRIAPFFTAEIFSAADNRTSSTRPNTLLQFAALPATAETISDLEICGLATSTADRLVLDNSSARLEVTPISLEGEPLGRPQAARFPIALRGPTLISVYFDRKGATFSRRETVITLRASDSSEIGIVRLRS